MAMPRDVTWPKQFFAYNWSGKHFNPTSCRVIRNQRSKIRRSNITSTAGCPFWKISKFECRVIKHARNRTDSAPTCSKLWDPIIPKIACTIKPRPAGISFPKKWFYYFNMPIESSQYFIILFRVNQVFTFYLYIDTGLVYKILDWLCVPPSGLACSG